MSKPLSPQAQAVIDAFNREARPEPHHQREAIAAALRAAATQLRCDRNQSHQVGGITASWLQLLAIAAELEAGG